MSEAGVGLAVRGARRAEHDELEGEEKVAGTLVGGGQPALSSTCPGLKGGTKTQEISPPSSTPHLQFPTFCVSAFHQQAYDYKGVKQEGPFTKAGGTHELRVGVPAQGWGWRGAVETWAPRLWPGQVYGWHPWLCPRACDFTPSAAFCFSSVF